MKPLHVGLLLAGAALAGGLAVKMTQPLPIPLAPPAPQPIVPPVVPPAIQPKPTPMPEPPPVRAAAPEPVYDEPVKPPIRKIARAKPTQWIPARYQALSNRPDTPPATPEPRHVTLQTGMTIPVVLTEPLSGDTFEGSLAEPFAVDGLVIAEKGAHISGRNATLELATSDGQRVAIATDPWTDRAAGTAVNFRVASNVTITERQLPTQ